MDNPKIPQHVAFIMDGNRRWARENKLALFMGHNKGAEHIEDIVSYGADKGIKFLTFWAFSTENWKRSKKEVSHLMEVFRTILLGPMAKRLIKKGVRLQIIGDYQAFSKDLVESLDKLKVESENNDRVTVTIALNYGGRQEIIRAVNRILKEDISEIDEPEFDRYLYTFEQPDPELIIRTGGEQRLSGYLPWQTVYSELYFTDTYWPEFDEKAFEKALRDYADRERRFGK
ncbi:MAG: polyprenyl diphosphate synthase [Candidatus Levyibacteriota bacterium]